MIEMIVSAVACQVFLFIVEIITESVLMCGIGLKQPTEPEAVPVRDLRGGHKMTTDYKNGRPLFIMCCD